jgi:tetratricopeptide (TPR) repeat protein
VFKRKFTRKELQHDELVDVVSTVSSHLQRHRRFYLVVVALAVFGAVALAVFLGLRSRDRKQAAQLLGRARTVGELVEIYEKYPSTAAAPLALKTEADHFFREKRFQRALSAYELLFERYPAHPAAPFAVLGAAYSREALEKWEEALLSFRKVMDDYPDASPAAEAAFCLGRVYLRLGRLDSARSAFLEAIKLHPWSVFAHLARERIAYLDSVIRSEESIRRDAG